MQRICTVPAALLAIAAACGAPDSSPREWREAAGYRWRELVVHGKRPGFSSVAEAAGLRFQNTVSDSALLRNRLLGQGAGVALGDVDGDGLVDVFLARTEGPNALFRNLGGWRFEEITAQAGLAAGDRHSTGPALVDFEGDGDLDLLLLATTGPNAFFLNDGSGRFSERRDTGLDSTGKGGTTPALADVDGDGDLDLYVTNYKPYTPIDRLPAPARGFDRITRETSPGRLEVRPEHRADFKVIHREDMGGLTLSVRAEPDDFYLNQAGRFVRVPLGDARFRDAAGRPVREPEESFGLDARFADLTGDGAPELYVVNDFEDPDLFWLNDGRGNFRLADWTVQRQTSNSGMGIDVGDLNGDALPDFFEVDMLSNDPRRLKTQTPTHTAISKRPGAMQVQLQQQRNTLFLNRGDGSFAEIAAFAGVAASGWSWSTLFLDVDLDGWQDILVVNGHVRDVMDSDTQERLQAAWDLIPWQRHFFEYPPLPLRNVAWRNRGDLTFEDAGARWGFGTEPDISHALAAGDLDGDGDLDLVVNRLGAPALLLRNEAAGSRVAIRLLGRAPNTQAVGARIRVRGGATPLQEREVTAGGLYLAHSDYLASFATGKASHVRVEIRWRNGAETVLDSLPVNREYEIRESGIPARESGVGNRESGVRVGGPNPESRFPNPDPLFTDVSDMLRGHTHTENDFDDWGRQYLLPDALSTLGPGIAWFDLDRDGDEDLLVGSGKGGRVGVFRNDQGKLAPLPVGGSPAPADLTTLLGLAEPGGTRVIAGVSTWEARELPEMMGQPAVLGLRVGATGLTPQTEPLVGSHESAIGPLALADYDGDGDLDLFVGARAIPMRYPVAATSGLFRNEAGRFQLDARGSSLLGSVGLVSAALFTDANGDGHPDLLLAREWDALLLLLNDGRGGFTAAPASWGLDRWRGRWNGLASGDLDGDGRLDLVATNWGRNTMLQADSARPLFLVHAPIGTRGEVEMLLARHDSALGGLTPLNPFDRIRLALPVAAMRVRTWAGYAGATLAELLGAGTSTERLSVNTLDHLVFFNRGDSYTAQPLPAEAQFAPAFYAGLADFDGDGSEDVFLAQNFSPTTVGQPRYDAGRGLLLSGDGKGGLLPRSGNESGLRIYGDQRGAGFSDFDSDGRLDLAVSQNGAATRLFRNRGARPGLRVRLEGPPGNPDGVGALLRVVYGTRMGPAREIQAGSGYWSQNGAVQVLGLEGTPTAVWVRWPGGREQRVDVPAGVGELVVRRAAP